MYAHKKQSLRYKSYYLFSLISLLLGVPEPSKASEIRPSKQVIELEDFSSRRPLPQGSANSIQPHNQEDNEYNEVREPVRKSNKVKFDMEKIQKMLNHKPEYSVEKDSSHFKEGYKMRNHFP